MRRAAARRPHRSCCCRFDLTLCYHLDPMSFRDFHLEYLLSNPNKDFYKERNFNISKEKYTHNNEIHSNVPEGYKITIHSIDFTEYGERILIITDYFNKNKRIANLTKSVNVCLVKIPRYCG